MSRGVVPWLVDGHAHFHDVFDGRSFLEAATRRFRSGCRHREADDCVGVLLLADPVDRAGFRRLREALGGGEARGWRAIGTAEEISLVASRDGARVVVVAGRQIRTAAGLEVLALCTSELFDDGRGLVETLDRVRASGALAVVPWGFGKWSLGRGRRLLSLLRDGGLEGAFLGDSGGRPRGAPQPTAFREARDRGLPVLAGSDPLPFPDHAVRAGSYGFVLHAPPDAHTPGRTLRDAVRGVDRQPALYGRRRSLLGFCRDQARMHLTGRVGRPSRRLA